jgi:hypothetical protein
MKTPKISRMATIRKIQLYLHSFSCAGHFARKLSTVSRAAAQTANRMREEAYHEINERQFIFYRQSFVLGHIQPVDPPSVFCSAIPESHSEGIPTQKPGLPSPGLRGIFSTASRPSPLRRDAPNAKMTTRSPF